MYVTGIGVVHAVSQRDLTGAGADGRIEPLPPSRLRTLLQQLRGICWPRPGVVVLPFWNQSVAVNHLARFVADEPLRNEIRDVDLSGT